uniref:Uncharacterized protein n=1 Tax=Ditylum brightwellii TaxID=49249 RepID=A0A6V2BWI8_9STRA|mmetsp:Transcript_6375/g.8369  ORF Transcript_6375/g.8369 Transcript_6375/m.8369 type:complete len:204 (-) Transcript_6375:5-616(-)
MFKTIALLLALPCMSTALSVETKLGSTFGIDASYHEKMMHPIRFLLSDQCETESGLLFLDPTILAATFELLLAPLSGDEYCTSTISISKVEVTCDFGSYDTSDFAAACEKNSGQFVRYSSLVTDEEDDFLTKITYKNNPFCLGASCSIEELGDILASETEDEMGFNGTSTVELLSVDTTSGAYGHRVPLALFTLGLAFLALLS